jgi:hypothetical protein
MFFDRNSFGIDKPCTKSSAKPPKMASNYQQLSGQHLPLGHRPPLPRPIPARKRSTPRMWSTSACGTQSWTPEANG